MTYTYGGFTEDELHAAFDKVKDPTNWKLPIDAVIDRAESRVTSEAITYFAGGIAEVYDTDDPDRVRVTHEGYYHWICA